MSRLLRSTLAGGAVVVLAAVPAAGAVGSLVRVSGASPFAAGCNGVPQSGQLYANAEVEPWVDVNPAVSGNVVGIWQQDRWSNGGSNGLLAGYSTDGGITWTTPALGAQPRFSVCAGGTAGNGGDFQRASDPWVSFSPNGDAYAMSLSFNDSDFDNALLVSKSTDGGKTWGPNVTLLRENNPHIFNDKNSLTADPTRSGNVYAVWDRLVFPNERSRGDASAFRTAAFRGPVAFTRTTDGGATWEPVRLIYDPGQNDQTIGNQIAVMPDGDLVNAFTEIRNDNKHKRRGLTVTVLRSGDQGRTWSAPIGVNRLGTVGVTDPRDGAPVRTGDILPEVAADERTGTDNLYLVWQDARFTGGQRDQIAFARSSDGGQTWSAPVRVSSNAATQAFTPSVHVAEDGTVAVTYYDFSADTTASPTLDTQYWVTTSTDGGATWSAREQITRAPFDMRSAPFAGGYFTGDYEGLASAGTDFISFSAFANTGITANPTDIFASRITP